MSSFPLIGSFVAATVIPTIYEDYAEEVPPENGFGPAHLNGFWVCIACFIGILILCVLDRYVERTDDAWLQTYVKSKRRASSVYRTSADGTERRSVFKQAIDLDMEFKCSDLKTLELPFWLTCFSAMATYVSIVNWIAFAGYQN